MARKKLIQIRRDTAADWAAANPVLASGEAGLETDTNKLKYGNGALPWNLLPYFTAEGTPPDLTPYATKTELGNHEADHSNPHGVTKAQVGLSDVPNTDFTAAVAANTAKVSFDPGSKNKLDGIESGAQVNKVTSVAGRTGAVNLDKNDVGLGNVSNTSDANKPVSNATQIALNSKQDKLVSGSNIKTVNGNSLVGGGNVDITASVGFGNLTGDPADNIKLNNALGAKAEDANLVSHVNNTSNPHNVTKAQLNLSNVDNTSDANKPISTATQGALNTKLENITGLVTAGSNVSISGSGTNGSPYVVNSSGGVSDWGDIGGTLSDQTDLQSALGDKFDTADVIDEDDMASDSPTKVPTQQSVKSYVDNLPLSPSIPTGTKLRTTKIPQAWFDSLKATSGIRYVVVIADSFGVFGEGAFPYLLEKHLINMTNTKSTPPGWKFAKGGAGGIAPAWNTNQGAVEDNTISGYGARMTAGQKGTLTAESDGITVFYRKSPGAGSLIVRNGVGGTVLTTINTSGAAGIDSWSSGSLPSQSRTFEFEATGGTVIVDGAYVSAGNRTSGIRVISASRAGEFSKGIVDNPVRALDLLAYLDSIDQLALVITATGTNDTPERGWQGQVIDAVKSTVPNAPVVSWVPPINGGNPPANSAAMKADVLTRDVEMIDGTMLGRIDGGDNVHPDPRGHSEIAAQIAAVISGDAIGAGVNAALNSAVSLHGSSNIVGSLRATEVIGATNGEFNSLSVAFGNFTLSQVLSIPIYNMKETPDTSPQISMLTKNLSNATLGIDSPTITLGDGTGVDNATLYRSAANTLATPGAMLIENGATINGSIGGTAIVDEDDMASDSDTKVPTQQSVKAYVDANAGGGGSSDWGDIGGNIADQTDLMEQIGGRMADGVWVTSGTYYVAPICQGINLTFTPVYNRVYLYPIFAPALIRTFGMGVSFSAVTGTIMVRQAIYGSDAQGRPTGSPISKYSSTRTTAGPHNIVLSPYANVQGKLWLAVKVEDNSSGATCTVRSATGAVAGVLGASSVQIPLVTGYPGIAWDESVGDFGAAPAESDFLYGQENIPRSYIRVQNAI